MNRLGIKFLYPLDGILVNLRILPNITFASTHLYALVPGRKSVMLKNTKQCARPGLEPITLDPDLSVQTAPPIGILKSGFITFQNDMKYWITTLRWFLHNIRAIMAKIKLPKKAS